MKILDFDDIDSAKLSHDEKTIVFHTWTTDPVSGETEVVQVQLNLGNTHHRSTLRLIDALITHLRVRDL